MQTVPLDLSGKVHLPNHDALNGTHIPYWTSDHG